MNNELEEAIANGNNIHLISKGRITSEPQPQTQPKEELKTEINPEAFDYGKLEEKVLAEKAVNLIPLTPQQIGEAWAVDAVKEALNKATQEEALHYIQSLYEMSSSLIAIEIFNKVNPIADKNKANKAISSLMANFSSNVRFKISGLIHQTKKGSIVRLEQGNQTDEN